MAELLLEGSRQMLGDDRAMYQPDLGLGLVVFGKSGAWTATASLNNTDLWIRPVSHG